MRVLQFGVVLGSLSDLPGLRLSRPLQSRPAQISDETQDNTEQLELYHANIAAISCAPTRTQSMLSRTHNVPLEGLRVVACARG